MQLNNITITNFKSIENLYLEFTPGMWKITGNVGAGKTSIGEAILFGLYGSVKDKKVNDLIRWGQKKCYIGLSLTINSRKVFIERTIGSGAKFNVTVDNVPIDFTNKNDLQKQLEDLFDVQKSVIEALCIISFNNFKSVVRMSPTDLKKFQDQLLGLYVITNYSDNAKNLYKETNNNLLKVKNDIAKLDAKLEQIKSIKGTSVRDNLDKIEAELIEQKTSTSNEGNIQWQTAHNKFMELNEVHQNLLKKRLNIISSGQQKKKEIESFSTGICPCCKQQVPKTYISKLEEERLTILDEYNKVNDEFNNSAVVLNDSIVKENEIKDSFSKQITEITNKLAVIKQEIELAKKLAVDTAQIENDYKELESQVVVLDTDCKEWDTIVKILNTDVRNAVVSQYVPLINTEITNIVDKLNCPYAIRLNNDFAASISVNDMEINISSLSTGQGKTLDMIIILAIAKSIIHAVNFNVFFLDELFANMDAELRDNVCQVISDFAANKTVFIISHADISDNVFAGAIEANIVPDKNFNKSLYNVITF